MSELNPSKTTPLYSNLSYRQRLQSAHELFTKDVREASLELVPLDFVGALAKAHRVGLSALDQPNRDSTWRADANKVFALEHGGRVTSHEFGIESYEGLSVVALPWVIPSTLAADKQVVCKSQYYGKSQRYSRNDLEEAFHWANVRWSQDVSFQVRNEQNPVTPVQKFHRTIDGNGGLEGGIGGYQKYYVRTPENNDWCGPPCAYGPDPQRPEDKFSRMVFQMLAIGNVCKGHSFKTHWFSDMEAHLEWARSHGQGDLNWDHRRVQQFSRKCLLRVTAAAIFWKYAARLVLSDFQCEAALRTVRSFRRISHNRVCPAAEAIVYQVEEHSPGQSLKNILITIGHINLIGYPDTAPFKELIIGKDEWRLPFDLSWHEIEAFDEVHCY